MFLLFLTSVTSLKEAEIEDSKADFRGRCPDGSAFVYQDSVVSGVESHGELGMVPVRRNRGISTDSPNRMRSAKRLFD